jgi:dTDP-4-dehydrorhamnose 3,5-epimerase
MNFSQIENLKIKGCWVFRPIVHPDVRGLFHEWFQDATFTNQTGEKFEIAQANCSVSNKGVIRGIHFAKYPPGQAKYVTCFSGKVFDVVVDLRKGSPTFGKWQSIVLDSKSPTALYIPTGIGHAFMALEDNTTFAYLCDQPYDPTNEFGLSPFDEEIAIVWPEGIEPIVSEKDLSAPRIDELSNHFNIFSENETDI